MPFNRPTLTTLINRARSDIETRLDGVDALLRRSFERAMSYAIAGLANGLHGHLFFISRQLLPDTSEEAGVLRWANILNRPRRDATFTTGDVDFTGVGSASLPAGTQFQTNDGVIYEVDSTVSLSGGAVTTSVTALESGNKNLDGAVPLTIVSPVANIDKDAVVSGGGLTGGADVEDVEDLRDRVLARLRNPPSGGGPGDYVDEMLKISGVTRAWENGQELGAGTVALRFATDDESSPIPSGGKVAEVQAVMDLFTPIQATATASAPIAGPLDPEIVLVPDTAAVRAAVTLELEAFILRESSANGVTLKLSQINEAISLAPGETDHTLVSPAADVVVPVGTLTTLGTITWS